MKLKRTQRKDNSGFVVALKHSEGLNMTHKSKKLYRIVSGYILIHSDVVVPFE